MITWLHHHKETMITTADKLAAWVTVTLQLYGPMNLGAVLAHGLSAYPDIQPGTIHDTLNTLVQSGDLQLSAVGLYSCPSG